MHALNSIPLLIIFLHFASCGNGQQKSSDSTIASLEIVKTEEEWKKILSPEQYFILREKGTERAFSGKYYKHFENGTYTCAACGTALFKSNQKYDSNCGWPSFFDEIESGTITRYPDNTLGMSRVEIRCAKCGGHLGHVFNDGPKPTGERYCVNSLSIDFLKLGE